MAINIDDKRKKQITDLANEIRDRINGALVYGRQIDTMNLDEVLSAAYELGRWDAIDEVSKEFDKIK